MRTLLLFFAHPWFWAPCLLAGLTLLAADQFAPQVEYSVAPTAVFPEQGFAFVTPVPRKLLFPFRVQGAGPAVKASGTLVLFEDGFPLGPIDVGHVNVPSQGKGLYFHWGNHLYFSSSDGTDPRSNGRLYSYRVQSALHPIALSVAFLLSALAVLGLAAHSVRQRTLDAAEAQKTGHERHILYAGRAVVVLGVLGLVALWLVAAMSAPQEGALDASVIKHARLFGYVAPIETGVRWPLRAAAAPGSAVPGSALTIAEDHKQVGRYELDLRKLTDEGAGRYALYGDRLIFSTLDRTDPRTNGRTYNWKLPVEVDPAAWASLLAILAVGVVLSFRASVWRGLIWLEGTSLVRIGAPSALDRTSTAKGLTVVFACAVAVYLVTFRWEYGQSSFLGFMGYLPISDALGYYLCSVGSSGIDTFPLEWCARRIFYPTALASYLGFTGWRPQLVLFVQAAMIGGAICVFAFVVARYFSRLAAIVAALGLFGAAYEFAIGNFMTEALGIPLGLFGLALLLAYAGGQRHTPLLYSGLALFSIGMFARMGALLVLPLLALWACVVVFRSAAKQKVILCLGALVAIAAGPILQVLLVLALGGDPGSTGGNYATTLYGLSTGSRDWSQSLRDFEQLSPSSSETAAFAKIRTAALANIRDNPSVFLRSLLQNAQAYATSMFTLGSLARVNNLLTAFWLIGMVWCVAHARGALAALLLVMSVGELISVPLVFTGISDHRVLAVSLGARVLLVGVGLTWLTSMLLAALVAATRSFNPKLRNTGADSEVDFSTRLALVAGISLAVLAFLPATPVRHLFALPSVSGAGCPQGQQEVVARIGRESMALAVGSPLNPVTERMLGVRVGQAEADPARPGSWWAEHLPALRQSTMLLYAIQLMPSEHGRLVPLVFDGHLPGNSATPLSFCYDPKPTSIQLADYTFRRVLSVRAVWIF